MSQLPRGTEPQQDAGATVARFEIRYTQYLDQDARPVARLPGLARDRGALETLYGAMVRTRQFDRKAIALQRTGQLGTYASSLGQEAIGAAIGHAMRPEDVLLPAYREYAAQFLRGVTMHEILLYWGGDERGMDFKGPREDFPLSVPIATHAPHAAGVGYAFKLRRQPRVAVCVLGDGATSKGDFYESINMAGAHSLPVVYVVCNNMWAISVPRSAQSAAETLAQKALAAGFGGEQVDGNDVIAMREVFGAALERARAGHGPHLIEAITYRMSDHTTADDATRYRTAEEVERYARKDPIERLRNYLQSEGFWDAEAEQRLLAESDREVEKAVKAYLDTPAQSPTAMFDYLYATLPEALKAQRARAAGKGGDGDA
jgi:pyruvate dehydrogenase E1 component alpha subunit